MDINVLSDNPTGKAFLLNQDPASHARLICSLFVLNRSDGTKPFASSAKPIRMLNIYPGDGICSHARFIIII